MSVLYFINEYLLPFEVGPFKLVFFHFTKQRQSMRCNSNFNDYYRSLNMRYKKRLHNILYIFIMTQVVRKLLVILGLSYLIFFLSYYAVWVFLLEH